MVVGAGIVGAACAYYLTREGLAAVVVDRGSVAAGTTGAGEGNILVSDKAPGAELDLALLSMRLWRDLGAELGGAAELVTKGGLVVAAQAGAYAGLLELAAGQRLSGVDALPVAAGELAGLEPRLAEGLAGGVLYPQDMQVQPMLAAAHLLRLARAGGATVLPGHRVTGVLRGAGPRVTGVRTTGGDIAAGAVVNAAGTWGGEIAALAGAPVPVLPRRGAILVTEPLPPVVRHKVYAADYLAGVLSDEAAPQTSTVVEGTASGTLLIGASRERVGFDRSTPWPVLGRLARQAAALFPFLRGVRVIRAYTGFRPYCPDHLPVLGPDPRLPGLLHACGHEGAGVGLAPATGRLVAQAVAGRPTELPLAPYTPTRFGAAGD